MLFSSITFIYVFLPILLITYYITPTKYKNIILLIFSLLFYSLGEPKYIIILILSCIINYYLSKLLNKKYKKIILIIAIIYNIGQLFIFKYTDFFISNINTIFKSNISLTYIIMPIGISFFTFQALGYVIDVYNKNHKPAKSLLEFMTYISLFPQLIAGPIVRFSDIKNELTKRTINYEKISLGIKRFIIGLSKKVLLANILGEFTTLVIEESFVYSWLKPIFYTLQIYFDFSGYSDMAIGLGLMLGFNFLENFNYPLIANSITDFWRRWHISLSSWFRDYLYIPLGGNRVSTQKWIRNLLIVWFLTGFWHGANWNFIIWGLYFGILLIIEKVFLKRFLDKTKIIKYIYTLLIVIISFLIFSTTNINELFNSLKNMFLINNIPLINKTTIYYFRSYIVLLIISIISATPILKITINKIKQTKLNKIIEVLEILEIFIYFGLLTLSTAYLIDESFNPFLYFRF